MPNVDYIFIGAIELIFSSSSLSWWMQKTSESVTEAAKNFGVFTEKNKSFSPFPFSPSPPTTSCDCAMPFSFRILPHPKKFPWEKKEGTNKSENLRAEKRKRKEKYSEKLFRVLNGVKVEKWCLLLKSPCNFYTRGIVFA